MTINGQTKKCPLCAEAIPIESITCEYCGANFSVTITGYCTNCHEMRDADAGGNCKVCGTNVTDLRVKSKLIEEAAPQPAPLPSSRPPLVSSRLSAIPAKKSGTGLWIGGGILALFIICSAIGAALWSQRTTLPVISGLFTTLTPTTTPTTPPTSTPTVTPTFTPSPTSTSQPTTAATPLPDWAINFSEPILLAIKDRPPNFQDDFRDQSGGWSLYYCADWRMQYVAGELVLTNCDVQNQKLKYTDFVLEVDARFVSYDPADGRWGVSWGSGVISINNWGEISWLLDRTTMSVDFGKAHPGSASNHILLIVKGTEYAVYVNDQPLSYVVGDTTREDNIELLVPRLDQTKYETVVAFDNFKIWDISDLP